MRILQVNSASTFGGGETHVLQLVEALRKSGHNVSVAGRRNGPLTPDFILPFRNSTDFLSALRLRSILKQERFDVVHAHVARDYTVVAAGAWGNAHVKVVLTRHLLHPIHRNVLYKRIDGWIAPTAQILKTLEHLKPKQSAIIPNWVDLEKYSYRPHSFHNPVTIGLLGQIAPHKGHDDAVEAMRRLGDGFRLLIAGRGDPSYESDLKRKAAGLPVEFLGFVPSQDFFGGVDVLIVPSWEEPFGLVVLEAMAAGIPVIATNCGGPAEFARGVLIPPRDPEALAQAIRSIRSGDLVKDAREHVEKNFDLKKVVPQIEEFYRKMGS